MIIYIDEMYPMSVQKASTHPVILGKLMWGRDLWLLIDQYWQLKKH